MKTIRHNLDILPENFPRRFGVAFVQVTAHALHGGKYSANPYPKITGSAYF